MCTGEKRMCLFFVRGTAIKGFFVAADKDRNGPFFTAP